MGFIKITLIAGGILLGLGAVGGVAAGVVSAQKQETVASSESVNPKPDKSTEMPSDDQPRKDEGNKVTASSVAKQIKEEDIVLEDSTVTNKEKELKDVYAFDLKDKKLKVKASSKNLPEGYEATVTLKEEKASVADLNDGKLTVSLTVTKTDKKESETIDLTITTFKKADSKLVELFDKDISSTKADTNYLLTLVPTKDKATEFITVEELNKQADNTQKQASGLTTLLTKTDKKESAADVTIEGTVKLETITKGNDDKTIFKLVSANENDYLKLVKEKDGVKEVALIGAIRTTNLLATDLKTFVLKDQTVESEDFNKTLVKNAEASDASKNNFKVQDGKLSLEVKKDRGEEEDKNDVSLVAFVYKNKAEKQNINIPLGFKITFGTGKDAKIFDSTNEIDAKLLESVGMSFHFYTRLLDKKDDKTAMDIKAEDLTTGDHNLGKYLITENYKTPATKPDTMQLDGKLNAAANNNFYVLPYKATDVTKGTELKTEEWTSAKTRNYIVFADYSYTSAGNKGTESLKEKVLYSPNLSLIHVIKDESMR